MADRRIPIQELLDALQHPTRRKLLLLTLEQAGITVRMASRRLRCPQSDVRYHMSWLADRAFVEPVDREPREGTIAVTWGPTERGKEAIGALKAIDRWMGR